MNKGVPATDAAIRYYDAEFPSLEDGEVRAEVVARLARLTVLGDVAFYKDAANRAAGDKETARRGPVAEIGCGTGRLSIPLGRAGLEVYAVDVSEAMLDQLRAKLAREPAAVRGRVHVTCQDAAALALPRRDLVFAAMPFNVLMLIPDLDAQQGALAAVGAHMAPGGVLALDLMNPLLLPFAAQTRPAISEPRRNPVTGNSYVRHSLHSAVDADQRQRVYGVYEEMHEDGRVTIAEYGFHWRMIFRDDIGPMLEAAGFAVERVAGDFEDTDWTAESRRIVVTARRV